MGFNLVTNLQICPTIVSQLMGGKVGLIYYSHIPSMVVALLLGSFVLFKGKRNLAAKLFFLICLAFSFWTLLNFISWVSANSTMIMFSWSLLGIFGILINVFMLYFVYVFIDKRDISFKEKVFFAVLILPIIILTPTKFNLTSFDVANCMALDNFFGNYIYFPQAVFSLWTMAAAVKRYIVIKDEEVRKQIVLLTSGSILFLVAFFGSGYLADKTGMYSIELSGLFAMVLFLAFFAFLIIKYKTFNIKLLGAQALVIATVILIGSQFAFIQNATNKVLTAITLVLVVIFGWLLVASVKKEVKQKEKLEKISGELQVANLRLQEVDRQKTEFLSIASHQLRTPLSILKGYIELIQDGAFGKITSKTNEILKEMDVSNERLVKLIDEFLDITRIEEGRAKFSFSECNFNNLIDSVVKELAERAKVQGLKLIWTPNREIEEVYMDEEKVRHVIFNFIDNAIKYSDKGDIIVKVEKEDGKVLVKVKDSGLGFGKEDEANFFQKFYRGLNVKTTNVTGTGIGLFVCRKFIENHHGQVWAHSAGLGQGSEFGFWIPINKPE